MKSFRQFAVIAAGLAFALAVLGSWVRINGAGMTCPDWPLCKGALIPALYGKVILEWLHRLIALIEGFVLLGVLLTGWRTRKRIAGVKFMLLTLGGIFFIQIALGGLTVALANRPDSVVWHWATAMALLAALTILAVLASLAPRRPLQADRSVYMLATAAAGAFLTMCVGAYVSSSGAGLACPAFPNCADHFWGIGTPQSMQMLHRAVAGAFFVLALIALQSSLGKSRRVRNIVFLSTFCTVLQGILGAANIAMHLPTLFREAHAANAAITFLAYIVAATVAAIENGESVRLHVIREEIHVPSPSLLHDLKT